MIMSDREYRELEFSIFCIENLALKMHIKPRDAYDILTKKTDLLQTYEPDGEIDLEQLFDYTIVDCRQSIDDNIRQGKKTLKAIAGLAEYIDKHDENAHAKSDLFWPVIYSFR